MREEDRILIITEKLIDCIPYSKNKKDSNWADCFLRKWLNEDFLYEAFDKNERARIIMASIESNYDYDGWEYCRGVCTADRIFALSTEDATKYFVDDEDRCTAVTSYAEKRGSHVSISNIIGEHGTGWWWLRDTDQERCAARVYDDGSIEDTDRGGNWYC